MAEELGERTELPTERRRSEARRRGQIAKSPDLSSALDLAAATIMTVVLGGLAMAGLAGLTRRLLEGQTAGDGLDPASVVPMLSWTAWEMAKIVVPAMLVMFVVACAVQVMQVGWTLSSEPLKPNLSRLNPAAGLGRLFNKKSAVKTVLSVAKLCLVGVATWAIIARSLPHLASLPLLETLPGFYRMGQLALELAVWLLVLLLVLGIADWAYQRWQHTQDLRMTKQEIKEERKMNDGDPEMKGRRLRMARDIALQRIQAAVPKADVIVTNPTHFAVALQYDPATMRAPKVVAKGVEWMALRIRQLAAANGVAVVERPPLARALYYNVEVGREIPAEHYEAVAEVLAYVYRTEGRAA